MEKSILNFIKSALKYYDNQNIKIKNNIKYSFADEYMFIYYANYEIKAKYEILGSYVNTLDNNYFNWGWNQKLGDNQQNNNLAKYLLHYGLSLSDNNNNNIEEQMFLKSILINPKIEIVDSLNLDIYLACYSYILKDLIQFIYPITYYINKEKTKYIIYYYLLLN